MKHYLRLEVAQKTPYFFKVFFGHSPKFHESIIKENILFLSPHLSF